MTLEIVTHCLEYPKILCFHLSGFVIHPPPKGVSLTLFSADDDWPVREVIVWFKPKLQMPIKDMCLPRPMIGRRGIGRNMAAKATEACFVHFCDGDYIFTTDYWQNIFNALNTVPQDQVLAFPRKVMGSTTLVKGNNTTKDSTTGDSLIEACDPPSVMYINKELFKQEMIERKAIGGSQIVRRRFCREKGYCDGHPKYMKPSSTWVRTHEDKVFRESCGGPGYPIDVPGIYRIRHWAHGGLNMPDGVTQ